MNVFSFLGVGYNNPTKHFPLVSHPSMDVFVHTAIEM